MVRVHINSMINYDIHTSCRLVLVCCWSLSGRAARAAEVETEYRKYSLFSELGIQGEGGASEPLRRGPGGPGTGGGGGMMGRRGGGDPGDSKYNTMH